MERGNRQIERYSVLDSYRFLAASGVVFYHFENHLQPFLFSSTSRLTQFQHFVDFFFVLSGFILMHVYGERVASWAAFAKFMRKRFARLYPLHFVMLMLACMTGLAAYGFRLPVRDPAFFDYTLVPAHLLLIQAWGVVNRPGLNEPSWSLSAEMFVYLLFPALALLLKRLGPIRTILVAVAFTLCTEAIRARLGMRPNDISTFDFGIFRALPAFLVGMATCALVESRPPKPASWVAPHLLACMILAMMLLKASSYLTMALLPILVGLTARAERGGRPTILANRFFVMLGNASYAIYITHTVFQIASVHLIRALRLSSRLDLIIVIAVFYLVIVVFGVVSFYCFETPMRRLLDGSRRSAENRSPLAAN
jgi:peptidoglycan/LPS O-acetylase OafA/YrhL